MTGCVKIGTSRHLIFAHPALFHHDLFHGSIAHAEDVHAALRSRQLATIKRISLLDGCFTGFDESALYIREVNKIT